MLAWTEVNFCKVFIRLNRSIAHSRRRNDMCEFSTLLLVQRPISRLSSQPNSSIAAVEWPLFVLFRPSPRSRSRRGFPQFGGGSAIGQIQPVGGELEHVPIVARQHDCAVILLLLRSIKPLEWPRLRQERIPIGREQKCCTILDAAMAFATALSPSLTGALTDRWIDLPQQLLWMATLCAEHESY